MRPLTAVQRRALHLASRKAGAPLSSKALKGHVSFQTAIRLEEAGLALRACGVLRVTKAGLKALNAVLPAEPAVFLRVRDGLTSRLDLRVPGEPEVLTPGPEWASRAEGQRRLAGAAADAVRLSGLPHPEDRLRVLRLMALERGRDIRGDLRQLEHVVARIERKVTREDEAA